MKRPAEMLVTQLGPAGAAAEVVDAQVTEGEATPEAGLGGAARRARKSNLGKEKKPIGSGPGTRQKQARTGRRPCAAHKGMHRVCFSPCLFSNNSIKKSITKALGQTWVKSSRRAESSARATGPLASDRTSEKPPKSARNCGAATHEGEFDEFFMQEVLSQKGVASLQ